MSEIEHVDYMLQSLAMAIKDGQRYLALQILDDLTKAVWREIK